MAGTGAWGPTALGGRGRRWPRFLLAGLLSSGVAAASATASVATLTVSAVTENIEVVAVEGLDPAQAGQPLHVLVVGSDARDDLTAAERQALSLGTYEGERSDTVLLASISADRREVSLVSMPRDLLVDDPGGGIAKLTETYSSGREALVEAVTTQLGFPVNHYVEVSITGFIETVEVVGSIELCLDEPLVDRNSGADLPAGCQELEAEEALAYVRSREGALGDIERIERQQTFLRAMIREVLDTRLLLDPGQLVAVAGEVSENLAVDEDLTVPLMANVARDLQGALTGGVEFVTVPGYPREIEDDGLEKSFILAYEPGLRALTRDIRDGVTVPTRGTPEQREEVSVALWTGGRSEAGIVESTMLYGGFSTDSILTGGIDAGATTRVYVVEGFEEHADWVAAHLGADVLALPSTASVPDGRTVVVAVGDDAGIDAGQA